MIRFYLALFDIHFR